MLLIVNTKITPNIFLSFFENYYPAFSWQRFSLQSRNNLSPLQKAKTRHHLENQSEVYFVWFFPLQCFSNLGLTIRTQKERPGSDRMRVEPKLQTHRGGGGCTRSGWPVSLAAPCDRLQSTDGGGAPLGIRGDDMLDTERCRVRRDDSTSARLPAHRIVPELLLQAARGRMMMLLPHFQLLCMFLTLFYLSALD